MSRYAAAHADPQGPGDARPTALTIVKDEGLVGKLAGKTFLITGASSGECFGAFVPGRCFSPCTRDLT